MPIPSTSGSEHTGECCPVPSPAPSKQKTPRGTWENAEPVIARHAQNSAPDKKDSFVSRDCRRFLVLMAFIVNGSGFDFERCQNKTGTLRFHAWGYASGGRSCATSGPGLSTKF